MTVSNPSITMDSPHGATTKTFACKSAHASEAFQPVSRPVQSSPTLTTMQNNARIGLCSLKLAFTYRLEILGLREGEIMPLHAIFHE